MTNRPLTEDELAEIEAREKAATAKGVWHSDDTASGDWCVATPSGRYRGITIAAMIDRKADADFIAHARTDIPRLLAEVRRLRAVLERIEEWSPSSRVYCQGCYSATQSMAERALNP
jgi:hypothetical protein